MEAVIFSQSFIFYHYMNERTFAKTSVRYANFDMLCYLIKFKLIKYFEFEVWVNIFPIRSNLSSDMIPIVIKRWTEIQDSGFLQPNYIGNTFSFQIVTGLLLKLNLRIYLAI